MASFENSAESEPIKMMVLGDTGSGKTGALASLLAGGYNIRMLDFENGVRILEDFLKNPQSIYTKAHPKGLWSAAQASTALQRFRYESFVDTKRAFGGSIATTSATGWQRAVKLLENWKTPEDDFGPLTKWTSQDILVVDTLSFASKTIINFNMALNQQLGQMPTFNRDYRPAQYHIENLLALLFDKSIKCNVIVNCHIAWHTEQTPTTNSRGEANLTANSQFSQSRKGYPQTIGQAQWLIVGRYFNNVVQAKATGFDHRVISTVCDDNMELLKTSAPLRVKRQYPIETGLLELFNDLTLPSSMVAKQQEELASTTKAS